jgi:tRNA(Arg) A34 adenosine deaminase TadA
MCLAALSYAKIERIVYDKSMKEVFPDDKQAEFDSQAFVQTLNFVPKLEQVAL